MFLANEMRKECFLILVRKVRYEIVASIILYVPVLSYRIQKSYKIIYVIVISAEDRISK